MRVLELWRYPIKSIGGERLDVAEVAEFGIVGDRGWGLVDEETGNVLTARRAPTLLMATCAIVDGTPVTTTVEGDVLRTSADYSDWLGRPVRLERAGDTGGTYENPMDF
ncbi:MAG: MOSC N-terminal beta barrel domain-containing protein, partial [Acidimicrobiaceae bacterium]